MKESIKKRIRELIRIAYADACAKGLYTGDSDLITSDILHLISELTEIGEAFKKNRHGNLEWYRQTMKMSGFETGFETAFRMMIKDTMEDEIADCFIMLSSICGRYLTDGEINKILDCVNIYYFTGHDTCRFIVSVIVDVVNTLDDALVKTKQIANIYNCLLSLCKDKEIDIWEFVSLKLQYNRIRTC